MMADAFEDDGDDEPKTESKLRLGRAQERLRGHARPEPVAYEEKLHGPGSRRQGTQRTQTRQRSLK